MLGQLRQDPIGPEHEHAAVPVMPAGRQHRLGRGALGLLDEALDPARRGLAGQGGAGPDIAIAGLGPGRADAEGHEVARERDRHGLLDRRGQGIGVADQMVRGADPEHRLRGHVIGGIQGGQGDRGGGVAADRLDQPVLVQGRVDRGILPADQEVLRLGCDRDQVAGRCVAQQPPGGPLQQRVRPDQLGQMLGQGLAADRPEPGAGAAGEDHGQDRGHGITLLLAAWGAVRLSDAGGLRQRFRGRRPDRRH